MNIFKDTDFSFLDRKTRKILNEIRESFIPHTPYQQEKELMEAVRMGDLSLALEYEKKMASSGIPGKLSADPLRQEQILFISFITQITRVAIEAGVSEDLAFAMSDSYIQTSESCRHTKQIQVLHDRALRDFIGAVKHQKSSPPYSRAVRTAINYMRSHLQEKLSLDLLASVAGLSTGRFSHLFREETGKSPMAYLQQERMNAAENLLLYSDFSISEISAILGYSSESHFIKTFHDFSGISPGQYRKQAFFFSSPSPLA